MKLMVDDFGKLLEQGAWSDEELDIIIGKIRTDIASLKKYGVRYLVVADDLCMKLQAFEQMYWSRKNK